MIPVIYRIWVGPTEFDRILGVNMIGTKTAVLLVIIGSLFDRVEMFVDFAIAYSLLNFVGAIVISRYLNRTISLKEMEAKEKKEKAEKMIIEWDTAWNLGPFPPKRQIRGLLLCRSLGSSSESLVWSFFWVRRLVWFVFRIFTPGCMPPGKEPLSTMLMLAGFGLYTMGGFFPQQLVDFTEDTFGCFIHLSDESDEFARIDAGGFRG